MVQVLPHLLRGGHYISCCNPVLQLLHFSAQLEVVVGVVQLFPAVLCQLFQPCILLIHLTLSPDDLLTADKVTSEDGENKREKKAKRLDLGLLVSLIILCYY